MNEILSLAMEEERWVLALYACVLLYLEIWIWFLFMVCVENENTRKKLNQAFQVDGISCLVFLDKEAKAITIEGVEIIE